MRFSRTRLLVGDAGIERLQAARVAVIGLGGVGSYTVEALARAGIGHLVLVDHDVVEPSNLNRQLIALEDTIGRPKVDVARERIMQINPDAQVDTVQAFVTQENVEELLSEDIRYAVDAIDSLTSKIALLLTLHARGASFVSCLGAARRLDPAQVRVGDISETQGCPLARRMRRTLRKQGVYQGIRCVYSEEPTRKNQISAPKPPSDPDAPRVREPLGSISYMPGIVGLTAAGLIVNDILESTG